MKVGAYEVVEKIGEGGMGVVVRARTSEGRDVAIKFLKETDPARLARFDRERRLLTLLGEAEGFVPLLDAGSSPQGPYIVMPFVGGGTLRQRLNTGLMGVADAVSLARWLARALAVAHARGIVHRDLKPENVLFAADGRPLVADLGLAKHFERQASAGPRSISISRQGTARGTPGYMAPEQLRDAKSVGPQADVFALGAVLYECLSGEAAFAGPTFADVVTATLSGRMIPVREARPETPAWLATIVARALDPDATRRFADATALKAALQEGHSSSRVPVAEAPPRLRSSERATLADAASPAPDRSSDIAPPRERKGPLASSTPEPAPRGSHPATVSASGFRDTPVSSAPPHRWPLLAGAAAIALAGIGVGYGLRAAPVAAVKPEPSPTASVALAPTPTPTPAPTTGTTPAPKNEGKGDKELAKQHAIHGEERLKSGDAAGALIELSAALEQDTTIAAIWNNRGLARKDTGDPAGAIADFTRAIELAPELDDAWHNRALVRGQTGELDLAIADSTRELAIHDTANGRYNLAISRHEKKDVPGAIAELTRALVLDPKYTLSWKVRGLLWDELHENTPAERDLKRFVALAPGDPEAPAIRKLLEKIATRVRPESEAEASDCAARAVALLARDDVAGARRELDRAVELAPRIASHWNDRGVVRGRAQDTVGAVADYTRAIEADPGLAEAWCNRAGELRLRDRPKALRDLDRAIELDGTLAVACYNRGVLRAEAKEYKAALGDLETCLRLQPSHAEATWARATCVAELGDVPGARAGFERFLELAPSSPRAAEARAWLADHER